MLNDQFYFIYCKPIVNIACSPVVSSDKRDSLSGAMNVFIGGCALPNHIPARIMFSDLVLIIPLIND